MRRSAWADRVRELAGNLSQAYEDLSAREQRALRVGALGVAAVLLVAGLWLVNFNAYQADQTLLARQALVADLPAATDRSRRQSRLGTDIALPSDELIRRLSQALAIEIVIDVAESGVVRVQGQSVSFDAVVDLLGDLEAAALRVDRLEITSVGEGRVDLKLELAAR